MHTLIAEQAGHRAIAAAMSYVDHETYELERLSAERAAEARRAARVAEYPQQKNSRAHVTCTDARPPWSRAPS